MFLICPNISTKVHGRAENWAPYFILLRTLAILVMLCYFKVVSVFFSITTTKIILPTQSLSKLQQIKPKFIKMCLQFLFLIHFNILAVFWHEVIDSNEQTKFMPLYSFSSTDIQIISSIKMSKKSISFLNEDSDI